MTGPAKMRTVGVLGGMGPEATVLLMARVIALTPATDDCDHVPLLIDNNTQVPSRIKAIIEKVGEDPGPVLGAMACRLVQAGAEALAMPCNTAHHYAPLLKKTVSIPFLDMIELTTDHIARLFGSVDSRAVLRVGMLASPAVRITGLFDRTFAGRGLNPVYPLHQDTMLACIKEIKAAGQSESAIEMLQNAAAELTTEGVDLLLVACSELSLIKNSLPQDMLVVDAIDVLAEAVIAFSRGELETGLERTATTSAPVNGSTFM
ncbi:MAG: amino acid racemase [Desulfofustis sp.]